MPISGTSASGSQSPIVVDVPSLAQTTTTMTAPNLKAIVDSLDLLNNLQTVPSDLSRFFGGMQTVLDRGVFTPNLPVIGTALGKSTLLADLGNQLASAINTEFGTSQTHNLAAASGRLPACWRAPAKAARMAKSRRCRRTCRPARSAYRIAFAACFASDPCPAAAFGIPGLTVSPNSFAQVNLTVAFADPCIYIHPAVGLFMNVSSAADMVFQVHATLTDSNGGPSPLITGRYGGFDVTLSDTGTHFDATWSVNLGEPSGDGLLTAPELAAAGAASFGGNPPAALILGVNIAGNADAKFDLSGDYVGKKIGDPNLLQARDRRSAGRSLGHRQRRRLATTSLASAEAPDDFANRRSGGEGLYARDARQQSQPERCV